MKIIILALCALLISSGTYLYHSFSPAPAVFLIPEGYTGEVYVVYDQPNGVQKEYEGAHRLYRIPPTGVLFTQFSAENGVSGEQYFFVNPAGARKALNQYSTGDFNEPWTYVKNAQQPPRDEQAIIDGGVIWSLISAKTRYEYQQAFAGSYRQFMTHKSFSIDYIDSLSENAARAMVRK